MDFFSTATLASLFSIILIDIVLGGDNAVVIALACRQLPPEQRTKGIIWGTIGAIVLRVILTFFAVMLLDIPYLKLLGGIALLWIGASMLNEDDDDAVASERQDVGAEIEQIDRGAGELTSGAQRPAVEGERGVLAVLLCRGGERGPVGRLY